MSQRSLHEYSMRVLDRPQPSVALSSGIDGVVYLTSRDELREGPASLIDCLENAVSLRPDGVFLAQRGTDRQWRRLTYAQAWRDTAAVATWFIGHGLGPGKPPLMILSENSIEHAILCLGALRAGVPVVPVSPTYSMGPDFSRLSYAATLLEPAVVFAQDATRFAAALALAAAPDRIAITADNLDALLLEVDESAVTARRCQIHDHTIAKILLTSGSTGRPKGVINTHLNLAAAVRMVRQVSEPFREDRVVTLLDWLPWHHTYGGNSQFNGVMAMAGTMYIDEGRPTPGQFAATIENLREISPSGFGSVPAAYVMLADALERDEELRHKFFRNLGWMSYGGALLPQPLWDRMQRLAIQELGELLPFGTGWGMTETAAVGVSVYWSTRRTGLVGLPQPGATLKLVPVGDRMELRVKGPHVLPSYYRDESLNAAAFDEEGFFLTGDATRWVDPSKPIEGLEFAGRIAEDFKLQSGTWVQGSIVRRDLVAALQPYLIDAAICAPDRPWLGALVWLSGPDTPAVRIAIADKLAAFNKERMGSGSTIARVLVLSEPPSAPEGEVTDKRSINQRRVLERRSADVAALYAEIIESRVILPRGTHSKPAVGHQQPSDAVLLVDK